MTEEIARQILKPYCKSQFILRRKLAKHVRQKESRYCGVNNLFKLYEKCGGNLQEVKAKYAEYMQKQRRKGTLPAYIEKYGEEQGKKRYLEKNSRLSIGQDALKKNGYTKQEIKKIKEKQASGSASTTKSRLISLYGQESGQKLYDKIHRQMSPRRIEYWLKRGIKTEEQARKKVNLFQRRGRAFYRKLGWTDQEIQDTIERQTHHWTRQGYYKKYGRTIGELKFVEDRAKASSKTYFIEKWGPQEGLRRFNQSISKKSLAGAKTIKGFKGNSKIQKEFATTLYHTLPSDIQYHFRGYPILSSIPILVPPELELSVNFYICVPDIIVKNVIIEFDGNYWHSRPGMKQRDEQKDIVYRFLGYSIFRIKQFDYYNNPQKQISKAKQFIISNFK